MISNCPECLDPIEVDEMHLDAMRRNKSRGAAFFCPSCSEKVAVIETADLPQIVKFKTYQARARAIREQLELEHRQRKAEIPIVDLFEPKGLLVRGADYRRALYAGNKGG